MMCGKSRQDPEIHDSNSQGGCGYSSIMLAYSAFLVFDTIVYKYICQ